MADSLIYPELKYFQWATPDNANPRLARSCTAVATTLYVNSIPYDEDGNLITGKFLMGIKNSDGYVETVYVPAGGGAISGTTYVITGAVRGIALSGLDFNTGNSDLAVSHQQDDSVFCNISGVIQALVAEKLVFPIFANTTERDAQIPSPVNGKSRCYVTADGLYYLYAAGSWQSVDSGTVTPNASTTVAGKVEIATQSELNAGTDTGGTGAQLVGVPSNLAITAQQNKYTYAGTTAGTSTVYTATVTPAPSGYVAGQGFTVLIDETNGASPTINFNGLGAKNIIDSSGAAIATGILPSGALVSLMYNGTAFQVMNIALSKTPVNNIYTQANQTFGSSTTQFDVTNPSGTTYRYTYDGTGTDPGIDATTFPIGTVILITSPNLATANRGIFTVTGSGTNYFEVANASGVAETNKTIGATGTLRYISRVYATWTKPNGLKYVRVRVVGGGGGAKGASSQDRAGGGGGGYSEKIIAASTLGATENVTLGYGGWGEVTSAASILGGAAYQAGTSAFGTHLQATGGFTASSSDTGMVGGVGSNGDINVNGSAGAYYGSSVTVGGNGGNSVLGGGGIGSSTVDQNGGVGGAYGGGGGGTRLDASATASGGEGAPGVVIVTEYY